MTAIQLITVAQSTALFLTIAVGWFYLRADYEVDHFRQELFTIRDRLFDYATAGNITFDSPAYIQMRHLLNGTIRFAHRLTFWRVAVFFLFGAAAQKPSSSVEEFYRNLNSIGSIEVRTALKSFHSQVIVLIVMQIIRSSIILWPILLIFPLRRLWKPSVCASNESVIADAAVIRRAVPFLEEQAMACA